jgi:hypothetical protein
MALLSGGAVQQVDVAPGLVVLRVRLPGRTAWVLLASGRDGAVGLATSRPLRGAALAGADGERARLRRELVGARVVGLGAREVLVDRGGARHALRFEGRPPRASLMRRSGEELETTRAERADEPALLARGAELVRALSESSLALRHAALSQALARTRSKLDRRVVAVLGDLERIDAALASAAQATAFVAEAGRLPRGAREMSVVDASTGETLTMTLDPARSARDELDRVFRRARRLKLGRGVAERRLAEAERAKATLGEQSAALQGLDLASDGALERLLGLAREARAAASRDFVLTEPKAPTRKAPRPEPRRAYRTFLGARGVPIFVGRGGADNDELTLRVARPQDLWLHVKGRAGAHVVVRLAKNASCPADVLVDAALLAAHFGGARGELTCEVQYTPRKYVRKPRGSPPGLVVVEREKVLVLRLAPERIAALLAAEVDAPNDSR